MILLKPLGGLCNRLRAIDSGLVLSRRIQQPLHVLWTLGPELNCGFYSLFKPSPLLTVIEMTVSGPRRPLLAKAAFLYDYLKCRSKYPCVIFQSRMNRLLAQQFDFAQLGRYPSVYITCCNRFYRPDRRFQPFAPAEKIRRITETYTKTFSEHTVGVHIRRTDHSTVTAYSPEQGFIDAMQAQIEHDPQTTFYLATDSPEVYARFSGLFKDRIIGYLKECDRNSPKGIEDAMVDLWCLSKTRKIIGSHLSSFSETAAQIDDIPLLSIKGER